MKSPRKMESRGNPTVLISPLRKHRKSRIKEIEENSDDEVQLCRVRSAEGSPERPSTQRSHTPRMYHQSPQRLSYSSRIPSDASTEPLVPQTPNEGNSVSKMKESEATTSKARNKRKAEEPLDTEVETKVLRQSEDSQEVHSEHLSKKQQLQSSQQPPSASSSRLPSSSWQDAPTEPLAPQNATQEEGFSISRNDSPGILSKNKANTPIDSETLAKALHMSQEAGSVESSQAKPEDKPAENKEISHTQPTPKKGEQTEKQPIANEADKAPEGSMGPPNQQQQVNKRSTQEEEEERIAQEIDHLMKTVKCLPNYYKLVDKIGEGTFSTVYKAQDIRRNYYDNNEWEPQLLESAQNSFVSPSSSQRSTIPETEAETDKKQEKSPSSPKDLSEFVALKRVYDTSSPRRIANEIKILKKLKGSKCISPMITAFRQHDQVFVVMPYIQHDEFKSTFHKMELIDIKYYMKSLFTALQQLHRFKILHRDVKPSNFLYNIRKRAGYLIDFGLAESEDDVKLLERYVEKAAKMSKFSVYSQVHNDNNSGGSSSSAKTSKHGTTKMASSNSVLAALTNKALSTSTSTSSSASATPATSSNTSNTSSTTTSASRGSNRVIKGFIKNDPRLTIKANRAGTRGFRAPEILMRVTHQTCAIDVWAAGVILLCFLTNTYPFFLSNDEADALIELSQVYGLEKMQECARINNRHFETNINIPKTKLPWTGLIEALNKEKMKTWSQKDYDDAVMLLRRTMELDPNKRITAEEALKMNFLQVD